MDLNLALALDTAETQVNGGENAHRTLRHRHVVRAFTTRRVENAAAGTWLAPSPASAHGAAAFVLAYVSDGTSRAVLGAGSAAIPALK